MKINIKPSFDRTYKKLPHSEKTQIDEKIRELFNYYNKDMAFADLRVRKMAGKDNYFEIDTASNCATSARSGHKGLVFSL